MAGVQTDRDNRGSPKEKHWQRANIMATCCGADREIFPQATHYVN